MAKIIIEIEEHPTEVKSVSGIQVSGRIECAESESPSLLLNAIAIALKPAINQAIDAVAALVGDILLQNNGKITPEFTSQAIKLHYEREIPAEIDAD